MTKESNLINTQRQNDSNYVDLQNNLTQSKENNPRLYNSPLLPVECKQRQDIAISSRNSDNGGYDYNKNKNASKDKKNKSNDNATIKLQSQENYVQFWKVSILNQVLDEIKPNNSIWVKLFNITFVLFKTLIVMLIVFLNEYPLAVSVALCTIQSIIAV